MGQTFLHADDHMHTSLLQSLWIFLHMQAAYCQRIIHVMYVHFLRFNRTGKMVYMHGILSVKVKEQNYLKLGGMIGVDPTQWRKRWESIITGRQCHHLHVSMDHIPFHNQNYSFKSEKTKSTGKYETVALKFSIYLSIMYTVFSYTHRINQSGPTLAEEFSVPV